jgi:hypothetical protein
MPARVCKLSTECDAAATDADDEAANAEPGRREKRGLGEDGAGAALRHGRGEGSFSTAAFAFEESGDGAWRMRVLTAVEVGKTRLPHEIAPWTRRKAIISKACHRA